MDITHLVVNGCSWTYCQGLEKPQEQGWPALVAKQLGVKVVNLAVRGCGNDSIQRRTYEYVYENLPTNSKPLFVVAWSQYWRKEAWQKSYYTDPNHNDYAIISLPDSKPNTDLERALLENWSNEDHYRRTYLAKLSLKNLFENQNIPYLMSDYARDDIPNVIEKIKSRFPNMVNEVLNNPYQIKGLHYISEKHKPLPCGHDDIAAQQEVAEFILSELKRLHGEVNPINEPYLDLSEFRLAASKHNFHGNTEWALA